MLVDNREKRNEHIIHYFDSKNLPYQSEKMETADYTFVLPNYPELGLDRFVLIERKNSLDEIASNFTKERERFIKEFERIKDEKIHLIIEGATFKKLLGHSYRSQFLPKSFLASLLTWNIRYKCNVWFSGKEEIGHLIYCLFYYEIMEKLKTLDIEEK